MHARTSVSGFIRYFANLSPTAIAVIHPQGDISYAKLAAMIDNAGHALLDEGLTAGTNVSLEITSDRLRTLVLAIALADIGIAWTPEGIRPKIGLEVQATIRDTSRPADANSRRGSVRNLTFDLKWFEGPRRGAPHVEAKSGTWMYAASSGSTGEPKAIALSEDIVLGRLSCHPSAYGLPAIALRTGLIFGPGLAFGLLGHLSPWTRGGTLVIQNIEPGAAWSSEPTLIEHLIASPQMLQGLLSASGGPKYIFPWVKTVLISGSRVPVGLVQEVERRLCPQVFVSYGATEVGPVANMPGRLLEQAPDAVGYVHPWVSVQVVDEDDRPVSEGQEGRIRIRSPYMVSGYHLDPVTTEKNFRDGWFYPGDIGSLSSEGLLRVSGRESDFINAGGLKVAPFVIEDFLRSQPNIRDAAAFGFPGPLGVEEVWVAIATAGPVDMEALRENCQRKLQLHSPKRVLHVTHIPRTPSGKIQRHLLREFAKKM